jgi:hypothetical protein
MPSSLLYNSLYYFTTATTLMSGGLGFLLKIPAFYRPDAYLIGETLTVGKGKTPFEVLATYVFGIMYVGPLIGMTYAHFEGSAAAKRAAALMPFLYHTASILGVLHIFPKALNPQVAPLSSAAGMHIVYAALFGLLMWSADDNVSVKSTVKNQ